RAARRNECGRAQDKTDADRLHVVEVNRARSFTVGASHTAPTIPKRRPTPVSTAWKAIPAASPSWNETWWAFRATAIAPEVVPTFPGVTGKRPARSSAGR